MRAVHKLHVKTWKAQEKGRANVVASETSKGALKKLPSLKLTAPSPLKTPGLVQMVHFLLGQVAGRVETILTNSKEVHCFSYFPELLSIANKKQHTRKLHRGSLRQWPSFELFGITFFLSRKNRLSTGIRCFEIWPNSRKDLH